ncbi:hypothetical protein [Magnetospirillum sp. UT-4]|uniref:SGNH/GDSL hydrolase family protein n=1 Tax=Magnetospirillum sp. UT-4 TaxID=2681467 RepID=UPI0013858361|nr:hypothetical protein [Magnetospirillum sp. UT-4]CAA7621791.1 conserved membrane hypothetical protein [Magnetospirillum sp. UT-4]
MAARGLLALFGLALLAAAAMTLRYLGAVPLAVGLTGLVATAGLVLVSAWWWRGGQGVVLAALVAAALGVFLADLALRAGLTGPAAPPAAGDIDPRTRREVVADLRASGVRAYPALLPSLVLRNDGSGGPRSRFSDAAGREIMPLAGLPEVETVFCREGRDWLVYRSDERGFNNPRGLWERPRLAAVVVGDSFVHGACVPSGRSFVDRLRRGAEGGVLALGMAGNGPLTELATLREYLPGLKTDHVIWVYFEGNDLLQDIGREAAAPLLLSALQPGWRQDVEAARPDLDLQVAAFLEAGLADDPAAVETQVHETPAEAGLKSVLLLRRLRDRLGLVPGPGRDSVELFVEVIDQARRLAEAEGAHFHLVMLPSPRRYAGLGGRLSAELTAQRLKRGLSRLAGLSVIDLDPAFRADGSPDRLFQGFHYTEDGNALVARIIARRLGDPWRAEPDR